MVKKNYEILHNDDKHCVYERDTNQYVSHCKDYERAKLIVRNLNRGGGFNGVTPRFFCKDFPENVV